MINTFIFYIFDITKFYIFNNILDQTLSNLTLINSRMHDKKDKESTNLFPIKLGSAQQYKMSADGAGVKCSAVLICCVRVRCAAASLAQGVKCMKHGIVHKSMQDLTGHGMS
jgi:hypothetical protein